MQDPSSLFARGERLNWWLEVPRCCKIGTMNEHRKYDNPPITEAIIDLTVTPRSDLALDDLRRLSEKHFADYPKIENRIEAMGTVRVEPGGSTSASAQQKQVGFKNTKDDEKLVWQTRLNGFTLSRLAPYQSWELFCREAQRLWVEYRKEVRPVEITRLAVRTINRIDIPEGYVELRDYFRTSPEVSPDLPQSLAGFFMQLRIQLDDIAVELLINQTIVPPPRSGMISVILDLDLFRMKDVPQDEAEIWAFYEILHDRRNLIFESCITDKTRELFHHASCG